MKRNSQIAHCLPHGAGPRFLTPPCAVALGQLDELHDLIRFRSGELLTGALAALVAIVVVYLLWEAIHRRRRRPPAPEPDLTIDVSSLPVVGPPTDAPQLECYYLPVRLAVLVLAPVGRARELPPPEGIHGLIDAIVPGLAEVAAAHQTHLYYWPTQLSVRGFAHCFFNHARLPGDAGKGTPWCSVAGVFKHGNQPIMAGLVMSADRSNSLGQRIIEHQTKWLDLLRVKLPG